MAEKQRFRRSEELDLKRIATSVYVTKFPNTWDIRELWKAMMVYGTVADVFIPCKLSKIGRRFAFIRFIRVDDLETLIGRLNDAWYGSAHLFASRTRFDRKPLNRGTTDGVQAEKRPERILLKDQGGKKKFAELFKPNHVVSNDCGMGSGKEINSKKKVIQLDKKDVMSIKDEGTVLVGKVRELSLIKNINVVCAKEGFMDVDVQHIGGSWIWLEFESQVACERFKNHEDMQFYFLQLHYLDDKFVVDDKTGRNG